MGQLIYPRSPQGNVRWCDIRHEKLETEKRNETWEFAPSRCTTCTELQTRRKIPHANLSIVRTGENV